MLLSREKFLTEKEKTGSSRVLSLFFFQFVQNSPLQPKSRFMYHLGKYQSLIKFSFNGNRKFIFKVLLLQLFLHYQYYRWDYYYYKTHTIIYLLIVLDTVKKIT